MITSAGDGSHIWHVVKGSHTGACTGKYAGANLLMAGNSNSSSTNTNRVISNGFQSKTYQSFQTDLQN